MNASEITVAVVGLGYVGLPLAVEFGKKFRTIGYDLSEKKIADYRRHVDPTGEVSSDELRAAGGLDCTADPRRLAEADFVIVAVPTPVDAARRPDMGQLIAAAKIVGANLRRGATVIFESTVYPGATEEVCIPVLEKASGMRWACSPRTLAEERRPTQSPSPQRGEGRGEGGLFHVAYSPERINPGDKEHTLSKVIKVVSGDSSETLEKVAALYGEVVEAGVHRVSSIMVAEAAKVIENTQRDLNIALMNELAIIFGKLGIDTNEVLEAAGTKWNFLKFKPGLVGGHCIGVDPYYLTYKAETLGYHPQVILAGRRINDGMGKFVADQVIKLMAQSGRPLAGARAVVLGLTFKENCPDLRNSRVPDIVRELESFGLEVAVHDPLADAEEALREYGFPLVAWNALPLTDALILAVAHDSLRSASIEQMASLVRPGGIVADVKGCLDADGLGAAGLKVWRL
ncbi:MAG: nucleotide sugar dehydrogenase [Betaproteobacteria bacterium HGW-Betaproteobacteria-14]|nr:MAG: nucleotide sugar dehydrogenase [Betaproteobacteria bacterium HGW-Betaproteobacteria-14]PKO94854.1 MAG: nucleotide sugar dehydrogenase [Betaproteobacteria bacterium HGW-Betaproteobacteria-10]